MDEIKKYDAMPWMHQLNKFKKPSEIVFHRFLAICRLFIIFNMWYYCANITFTILKF